MAMNDEAATAAGTTEADAAPLGLVLGAAHLMHLPFAGMRIAGHVTGALPPGQEGLRQGRVTLAWLGADGTVLRRDEVALALPLPGDGAVPFGIDFLDESLPPGPGLADAILLDARGGVRATLRVETCVVPHGDLPLRDHAIALPLRAMRLEALPELPLGAPVPPALAGADRRIAMRAPGPIPLAPLEASDLAMMGAAGGAPKRFVHRTYPLNGLWAGVVHGATVLGQSGAVFGRGGMVDESWAAAHPRTPPWHQLRPFVETPAVRPEPCGDAGIWWVGPWRKHNYYHTHGEALCALVQLEILRDLGGVGEFDILLPSLAGWTKDAVELLGLDARRVRVIGDECLRPERLYWPSALLRHNLGIEPLLRTVCRRIRTGALAREAAGTLRLPEAAGSGDVVYVARTDSPLRPMLNEDGLIEALRARGVRIFLAKEMSYPEQVLCASRARVMIGPHGAGLTNVGFAPRDALLVEIHPHFLNSPLYHRFAQLLGCRYRAFTAPEADPAETARQGWRVDIPAFLGYLDGLLEAEARAGRL
ncbi:glycosyltransferase family 61 protein [Falsiroseomonas sp. HW251]|uniref:glycosyltransferase family 61 protein n=1 Tax=Falsiroseomonas sp. HW251 TaxID=3390998 RepID=UPI003D31D5B2